MTLAPYAVTDSISKGRAFKESSPKDGRSEYARDRDRVLHSDSFRRLNGKTQVFTLASNQYGSTPSEKIHYDDHMRNRMSHSLEVAQVARSIAGGLNLNTDLAETLALAHDLGHTPFGHSGQDVLNECMNEYGGFEHNIQSLRVVDVVEKRYIPFNGLNLMFETREGILKHCSAKNAQVLGDVAQRHREKKSPTLEAQATDLGDAIAYQCHDIDDGIRSGLVTPLDLMESNVWSRCWNDVQKRYPDAEPHLQVKETIRDLMGLMIRGAIIEAKKNLERHNIKTLDDVRNSPEIVLLPKGLADEHAKLKSLLYKVLYHNPEVNLVRQDVEHVIKTLFTAYMADPLLMSGNNVDNKNLEDMPTRARAVCDHIAGMTDAYAYQQVQKLEPLLKAQQSLDIL